MRTIKAARHHLQPSTVNRQPSNKELIMLYKFKSQAAATVIMLEASGNQMLTLIGKGPSAQGIITVEQIPAAIAAIQAAVAAHETAQAQVRSGVIEEDEVEGDGVMLSQRAAPFLDLLRLSAGAGKDVVWGV
jgi:cyclopropane-fatty-acyl-phospholipid synthase